MLSVQIGTVCCVQSAALHRQAAAEPGVPTLVHTAGASFEAPPADVACANAQVPLLAAQTHSVSSDPVAVQTSIVDSSCTRDTVVFVNMLKQSSINCSWVPVCGSLGRPAFT